MTGHIVLQIMLLALLAFVLVDIAIAMHQAAKQRRRSADLLKRINEYHA